MQPSRGRPKAFSRRFSKAPRAHGDIIVDHSIMVYYSVFLYIMVYYSIIWYIVVYYTELWDFIVLLPTPVYRKAQSCV